MKNELRDVVIFAGRPKTGKSLFAEWLRIDLGKEFGFPVINVDMIRDSLAYIWPELGVRVDTAVTSESFQEYIKRLMWGLKYEAKNNQGVIIEGFEISRKSLIEYYQPRGASIYCLGTLDVTPDYYAANIRKNIKLDRWPANLSDKELLEFAKNELIASRELKEFSHNNNLPFYNTALNTRATYENIRDDVIERLRKK